VIAARITTILIALLRSIPCTTLSSRTLKKSFCEGLGV
jgi:hypothetical protein